MKKEFQKETEGIYRLKVPFEDLYTSVFLIETEKAPILVDCATYDSDVDTYILPALQERGYALSDLSCVVVTHEHGDHAGGLKRMLEICPNLKVIRSVTSLGEKTETYALPGHTTDFVGVFCKTNGTLISGDGLQGHGVGKYRCGLQSKDEYLQTIEKIERDERIENLLFSHAYEPWYKDGAFGRENVEKVLKDCKNYVKENMK